MMTHQTHFSASGLARRQTGVSLIIVLIMMVVIGLSSASAIRNATSGEQATNNVRVQNLAQQYAEAALRYCEAEMTKSNLVAAPLGRMGTSLADANIISVAIGGNTGWENTATWLGTGGASASLTSLPQAQISTSDSAFKPTKMPQCAVEKQAITGGDVYVITARGFSPDYTFDSTSGKTLSGSVVWLQSTLYLE